MSNHIFDPLTHIAEMHHPAADLVRSYLESEDDWKVDNWFVRRSEYYFDNGLKDSQDKLPLDSIAIESDIVAKNNVRIVSITPHFFRGFRNVDHEIDLRGDLVVIDGRNSSGKTSLAEALEWVLTGRISRRDSGDPKELAHLIAHRLKQEKDETWVELVLEKDGEHHTIKRFLLKDYDSRKGSRCETRLIINGEERANSSDEVVSLFLGVPPILMQHSLRQFVLQNPTERRDYFETLLNLDEITSLIQRAVVGGAGLGQFARENGGEMILKWNTLKNSLPDMHSGLFSQVEESNPGAIEQRLRDALGLIAVERFSLDNGLSLENMVERLEESQRQARERSFPLLEKLRPKRKLDHDSMSQLSVDAHEGKVESLRDAHIKYETAKEYARHISEAQSVIASTLARLRSLEIIADAEIQVCPLCDYIELPTLSRQRIDTVADWNLASEIRTSAKSELRTQQNTMIRVVEGLVSLRLALIPTLLPGTVWPDIDRSELRSSLNSLRSTHQKAIQDLNRFDELGTKLTESLKSRDAQTDFEAEIREFLSILRPLYDLAPSFRGII